MGNQLAGGSSNNGWTQWWKCINIYTIHGMMMMMMMMTLCGIQAHV